MITQETIEKCLVGKIRVGETSSFEKLFTDFVFAGGVGVPNIQLIECLKYLLSLAIKAVKDDLALAILEKLHRTCHAAEEDIENKKKSYHMGEASRKADDKFFMFLTSIYFEIPNYKRRGFSGHDEPVMQKTRFKALEYAAQQWEQVVCRESYAAFRFLVKAFESQEKKEILDKILRPRIEKWFTKVEFIEQWLSYMPDPVPYEVQQLLVMARAKNGGPELAKRDITNSKALGPEDLIA